MYIPAFTAMIATLRASALKHSHKMGFSNGNFLHSSDSNIEKRQLSLPLLSLMTE